MRIGIIHGNTVADKNRMIFESLKEVRKEDNIFNFGCFEEDTESYTYVEIALQIGLLLASGALDFVVTGCSSGQGMMLACNSLPGILCGYTPTPLDAFLFGRINGGNVISLPLGEHYGWKGDQNLLEVIQALFDGPFGCGYPEESAKRKRKDAAFVKQLKKKSNIPFLDFLDSLNVDEVATLLSHRNVITFVLRYGTEAEIINWIMKYDEN